jgi:hypothetical protein
MAFTTGSYNIGTDQSVVITNLSTGAQVILDGRRTSFTSQANDKLDEGEAVDNGGLQDARVIPGRWSGTIEVERNNANFSSLFAFLEQSFFNGAPQTFFSIEAYEPTADKKSVAVFQYTKVLFHGYKPGTWARERVKASVDFSAQQRIQVQ